MGAVVVDEVRGDFEIKVERIVERAVEVGPPGRIALRRYRLGEELLIGIALDGPEPHELSLRVCREGAMLSVNRSRLVQFAVTDDEGIRELEGVLRAYCAGELETQVGVRDGRCHALRTKKGRLSFPGSFFSGRKEWRRIG